MIIYWDNLEKSANDDQTIPEYIASNYVPSVHFARNIYWEGQKNKSGGNIDIPQYIASSYVPSIHFARNIYWESQPRGSGKPENIPQYIASDVFTGNTSIKNAKARAYLGTRQSDITSDSWVKVNIDTESYDIGNNFDTANKKYVAPINGYYLISGSVTYMGSQIPADRRFIIGIYKNAGLIISAQNQSSCQRELSIHITDVIYLAKDDYIELYTYADTDGANIQDIAEGTAYTWITINLLQIA